jgi:hypothetical protein
MFISTPEDAFSVSVELGPPNAKYWKAVTLSTGAAWFVLTSHSKSDGYRNTQLLISDRDVADTIRQADCVVESLLCITSVNGDSEVGSTCIDIGEVWLARRESEDDAERVVFVDRDGHEREGLFQEIVNDVVRDKLILSIPKD